MSRGSCQCGAIRFEVGGPVQGVGNCHCSICRKLHGAPFSTYAQFAADALVVQQGEEHVRVYPSSDVVERSFCDTCGAHFTFRFSGMPEAVWIAAGLLEDVPELRPQHHIFVGSKASWHEITDDLPQHDEYPPMGPDA